MKKLFLLTTALFIGGVLFAQQGIQYTNFMFNKLAFNPAYAGSHEVPCLSAIHRSQWIGFEGAPVSQAANFHMPLFGKKVGLGVSIQRDAIGPTESYWANLAYAYRMDIAGGKFSIGLQASMRSYMLDLTDAEAVEGLDPALMTGNTNKVLPNFGAGVYFLHKKYYAGVSIPHIVRNDLSFGEFNGNSDFGREEPTMYGMAGVRIPISKKIAFKPAILTKYTANAPFDMDINATFVFNNVFGIGGTYRLGGFDFSAGDSFDALMHVNFGKFKIGTAYDLSLSRVREFHDGTFEIFIEYCMKSKGDMLTNPRFFF